MTSKRFRVFLPLCFLLAVLVALVPCIAFAAGAFRVDDGAELLTSAEHEQLQSSYQELTNYVDTAFVTTTQKSVDVEDFASAYVDREFGSDPAVIFVIDMYNRQVCVYANRAGKAIVSESDARAITDNVYRYAGNSDYFGCADAAFSQILARCKGNEIARPMKHVTNFLMAAVLGVLLNFFIVYNSRRKIMRERASAESMRAMAQLPDIVDLNVVKTGRVRHYHRSSSGGGGGGGGHSGGGGGGGGSSHRF